MIGAIIPKPLADLVNIASGPQRSLFRYPGGKTWLVPLAAEPAEHAKVNDERTATQITRPVPPELPRWAR